MALSQSLMLCIMVLSVTKRCTSQQNSVLEYDIDEEEDANRFVGNAKLDSSLGSKYPPDVLDTLEFSFRFDSGNYQLFSIERSNGIIRTRVAIDRDELCERRLTCDVALDIVARAGQIYEFVQVVVTINDINDNTPQFPEAHIQRFISETTNAGASIALPAAVDRDSGVFGVQSYDLEKADANDHTFALRTTEHSDGSMDVNLVLLRALDRESKEFYSFTVRAYDGDREPRSGAMELDITVTDSNDNNPRFDKNVYEATVFENLPRTSSILRVSATDPDSGLFGDVVYSFADSTPESYLSIFGLDNITGEVYVKGLIDYESEQTYTLIIQAKDRGPNSIAAFTRVNINVMDQNDWAPDIRVNTLTDYGEAEIREHAPPDTFVAHLSVQDHDKGGQQRFDCSINNSHFRLTLLSGSNKEYTINSVHEFDREDPQQRTEYEVLVECRDYGDPSLTSVEELVVNVLDINDHAPLFSRERYSTNVSENNYGEFIINMAATDADAGRNAAIVYAIRPANKLDDDNAVIIDRSSGVVTANIAFDYETKNRYQYIVTAIDKGSPPLTSSATLDITIRDVNDEYPVFNMTVCSLEIMEELEPEVLVETLAATDRDNAPFNIIRYSQNMGRVGSSDFRLDVDTGALYTQRRLNREKQSVYHLMIIASNTGYPVLNTTLNCTVGVMDINDNPPVIDYPDDRNHTSRISNKLPPDSVILRVIARDPDYGQNSKLSYQIAAGNEDDYFKIDADHGQVMVNKALDNIRHQTVRMSVIVSDHGHVPKSTSSPLVIIIDESMPLSDSSSSSGSFVQSNAMIILGVVLAVIIMLVVAIIVAACTLRKRRHSASKNKHIDCQLGNHETLKGSSSSSNNAADTSINSDSSSHSVKDIHSSSDKELTFTFDLEQPYLQQKTAVRPTTIEPKSSPCRCRYSDRPHPHHSDPRKMFQFGQYDRSPVQRVPPRPAPTNAAAGQQKAPVNRSNTDTITEKAQEATHGDVFNMSNHTDMDSECSGTDSGRGASEEGDNLYATHAAAGHGPYISKGPTGGPLYEVPENGWPEDAEPDMTQYHGFPSTQYTSSTAAQLSTPPNGNIRRANRLPHVEPLGMYVNSNSVRPVASRTPTPDHASVPKATNSMQIPKGKQLQPFVPPKPASYGLSQPVKNYPNYPQSCWNSQRLSPPNSSDMGLANRQSRSGPSDELELEHVNKHRYQANNSCDNNQQTSMPKMTLSNHNSHNLQAGESQESSFTTLHQQTRPPPKSIKKAVQFADDVIAKSNDVSNVRAINGHASPLQQRHDKQPLELRISEKSKQNQGFHDDMSCLSYSVV